MERIKTHKARDEFGSVVNRVAYGKERIVLVRRNKPMAAIIPMEDLHLLERLIESEEDRIDLEEARKALAEPGENTPLDQFMEESGLNDISGDTAAHRPTKAKATAKG